MFDTIPCYVSGNTIEVNGQTFLLGELTADMLNVHRSEYAKIDRLSTKIAELLKKGGSGLTLFSLRIKMSELRFLLIKQKLFRTLVSRPFQPKPDIEDLFTALFETPEGLRERTSNEAETLMEQVALEHLENNLIIRQARKYCEIVDDIYTFNKTMSWFINEYLSHLKRWTRKITRLLCLISSVTRDVTR